jgi:UDP-N-acetylbacillosamine N-acetyltransferase
MPRLVIWGASGHAMVVADIIRLAGEYELYGFLDDVNPDRHHTQFCGAPVLGGAKELDRLKDKGVEYLIFGFGHCQARLRLSEFVLAKGYSLAAAIHPKSVIAADVHIGRGTVVVAGAVINAGAVVGENVIINTSASVDHECIIQDGAHICPGAHLAGNVNVGQAAWIGIGAAIIERVCIGANVIIGAGAVVLSDIPAGVMAYGVPAKVIKKVDNVD